MGQLGSERHILTIGLLDPIVSQVMLRALRREIAEDRQSAFDLTIILVP